MLLTNLIWSRWALYIHLYSVHTFIDKVPFRIFMNVMKIRPIYRKNEQPGQ